MRGTVASDKELRELLIGKEIARVIFNADNGKEVRITLNDKTTISIRNDEGYQPQAWVDNYILK